MDRREFLAGGLAAVPFVAGLRAPAARSRREPLGLTTADKESHVVAVALASGRIRERIGTREGPRSIEQHGAGPAVVAHTATGVVSLIDAVDLRVRRVLGGFSEPRYTAIGPDARIAYVSDSGTGELAVVDLVGGRVVRRVEVGGHARHLTLSPQGRTLWVSLGSSAAEIAVVDVSDRLRPVVRRRIRPPFLAHDVGFSPSGRRIWVTAGRERRLAVYAAGGHRPLRTLGAHAPPQHVSFGPYFAYVASGNGATVSLHALSDSAIRRTTHVALGSYNIQHGAGHVLTPSLGDGRLTILDPHGNVTQRVRAASAAHDACVIA
jgi:DNA-binding beta-propeller fold protein YncE